jgi:hypothetical protein
MSMHEDRTQERQTVAVLVEEGEGLLERDCLLDRQPFHMQLLTLAAALVNR